MLTVARIALKNWKCYRGENELRLAPKTYAIVARREGRPDSSNWCGKSSLLESIDFALWGRLTKSCRTKRDWITRGEKSGEVEVELSDGTRVVRQMGIHGSEKVWCYPAEGGAAAVSHQDAAQVAIERLVGISDQDFLTTCYFQQRQMARLILSDPGPRMDLVAGWIRLGPLQECEDASAEALAEVTRRRTELETEASLRNRMADDGLRTAGFEPLPGDEAKLEGAIAVAREAAAGCAARLEAAREAAEGARRRADLEPHARRYVAIVDEGKRLKEVLTDSREDELVEARERLRVASERKGVADRELAGRVRLATGRFDGSCPLVGEPCPSRDFVVGGRERNDALRLASEDAATAAGSAYQEAARGAVLLQEAQRRADQERRRLQDLRDEARRLKPSYEQWLRLPDEGDGAALALSEAEREHGMAAAAVRTFESALEFVRSNRALAAEASEKIARFDAAARTASAAVQVFGKTGAQRAIAEEVLGDVEARAARTFERCGIELGVRMVWSREGGGLASTCRGCGQAFPASAKVKVCGRCGAERGPNLVNKLDFEVSDRSGGAEDLAGGVLQLAASSWLREDRASDWGVAMIDEPFGAMDAANRKAFAGHLPAILRDSGFGQAFVIAHHSGVLDALPGRIEITSDGRRSAARVV